MQPVGLVLKGLQNASAVATKPNEQVASEETERETSPEGSTESEEEKGLERSNFFEKFVDRMKAFLDDDTQ